MNENIDNVTYEFDVNGETKSFNLRNLVLYTENKGETPTCWYIYTTTGERLSMNVADGNAFVAEIVGAKGFDWYTRNKNKNYIFEVIGEKKLKALEDKFDKNNDKNSSNKPTEETRIYDTEDEFEDAEFEDIEDEDEDEDDNKFKFATGKLSVYGKATAIIIAALVAIGIGGKIVKGIKKSHNNTSTSTPKSTEQSNKATETFEELLASANNTEQRNFINSINSYLSHFNNIDDKIQMSFDEALALKIVDTIDELNMTNTENIFNGSEVNTESMLSSYHNGFLKVVAVLANTKAADSNSSIIDLNTTQVGKAYKYLLSQDEESVKSLLPSFYKKTINLINEGKATWEDFAICSAAYVHFGGLDNKTIDQINAKNDELVEKAAKKINSHAALNYNNKDGLNVEDFAIAWNNENETTQNYGKAGDNSRFRYLIVSLAKNNIVDGDINIKEPEESTTELNEENIETSTTKANNSNSNTTTTKQNKGNTTTTRNSGNGSRGTTHSGNNGYTYPSTTSDYSTNVYEDEPTSSISPNNGNDTNTTEATTEHFYVEPSTNPEVPTTEPYIAPTTPPTTEHYATYQDNDNWWETEGDVVGMSFDKNEKGKVLIKL